MYLHAMGTPGYDIFFPVVYEQDRFGRITGRFDGCLEDFRVRFQGADFNRKECGA